MASDKVTQLQEYMDGVALSMFNSLRLLPKSNNKEDNQSTDEVIQQLAEDLLNNYKKINQLINELPGIDHSKEQQVSKLMSLQNESDQLDKILNDTVHHAEKWREKAKETLKKLAEDKIALSIQNNI